MSERYSGGIISKTPVTPSGNTEQSSASGIWTLEQQAYWKKQNLWPTAGIPIPANAYIEYMFSSFIYSGTGATQTINNGINLSGNGGLVWIKGRSGVTGHRLIDTTRGATKSIASNLTDAEATESTGLTAFSTTGFTIGADADYNTSAATYVAWNFRKQAKFFEIVTWTGDATANKVIPHNLGSAPGCILVKQTNSARAWAVFHRSLGGGGTTENLTLNTTAAVASNAYFPVVNSTEFQVSASSAVNASGGTYVAYLFAHNAGGFGASGTENIISCGSYTGTGALQTINLGYEAQWVMIKSTSAVGDWYIFDVARGFVLNPSTSNTPTGDADAALSPNLTGSESLNTWGIDPAPNGFTVRGNNVSPSGTSYVYVAIRRDLMQVPTVGTTVYAPITYTGTAATGTPALNVGFPADWAFSKSRSTAVYMPARARLLGNTPFFNATTGSSLSPTGNFGFTGPLRNSMYVPESGGAWNGSGTTYILEGFRRAASFMDVVGYTGTGSAQAITHNLTVAPELMFVVSRNLSSQFMNVYAAPLGATKYLVFNNTDPNGTSSTRWNNTAPTATQFTVGTQNTVNGSGYLYMALLFGTAPGVSKVSSYTGTGALQTINCGFTTGARFVMIKRTDSTGAWYYWDSARGISSSNDPYLLWNSTDAEVTGTNYVDTDTTGFQVTAAAPIELNENGGTYIFLAIS